MNKSDTKTSITLFLENTASYIKKQLQSVSLDDQKIQEKFKNSWTEAMNWYAGETLTPIEERLEELEKKMPGFEAILISELNEFNDEFENYELDFKLMLKWTDAIFGSLAIIDPLFGVLKEIKEILECSLLYRKKEVF